MRLHAAGRNVWPGIHQTESKTRRTASVHRHILVVAGHWMPADSCSFYTAWPTSNRYTCIVAALERHPRSLAVTWPVLMTVALRRPLQDNKRLEFHICRKHRFQPPTTTLSILAALLNDASAHTLRPAHTHWLRNAVQLRNRLGWYLCHLTTLIDNTTIDQAALC